MGDKDYQYKLQESFRFVEVMKEQLVSDLLKCYNDDSRKDSLRSALGSDVFRTLELTARVDAKLNSLVEEWVNG